MEELLKLFGGPENIWVAIKDSAAKVGVESTRMMLDLFYVLKSPETSIMNKTIIVTALGYQLLPEDVLPRDRFGLLGILDNVVTIGFAYSKVKSSVTPQIEGQVNHILQQWFGESVLTHKSENWSPSNEPSLPSQPVYQSLQSQDTPASYPYNQPQKSVWDDEDDVVID